MAFVNEQDLNTEQYNPLMNQEAPGQFVGPSSYWDQLKTQAAQNLFEEGPTAALGRTIYDYASARTFESQGIKKIPADELNKEFGSIPGVKFNGAEYYEIAKRHVDQRKTELAVREYIDRGGSFGFGSQILAGTAAMVDPINLLANIATSGAVGLAERAAGATLTLGKAFAVSAAANSATNLVADFASWQQMRKEFTDRTPREMIASSLVGGIVAGGIDTAFRWRASKAKEKALLEGAIRDKEGLPMNAPVTSQTIQDFAQAKIDPTKITASTAYQPMRPLEEMPLFKSHSNGQEVVDDLFGQPAYLDDSLAANTVGDVSTHVTDKPHFLIDADAPLGSIERGVGTAELIKQRLEESSGISLKGLTKDSTLNDVIAFMRVQEAAGNVKEGAEAAVNVIKKALMEQGIDGVHTRVDVNGQASHNKVVLFNDFTKKVRYDAQNTDVLPKAKSPVDGTSTYDIVDAVEEAKFQTNQRLEREAKAIHQTTTLSAKPDMTPDEVQAYLKELNVKTSKELKLAVSALDATPEHVGDLFDEVLFKGGMREVVEPSHIGMDTFSDEIATNRAMYGEGVYGKGEQLDLALSGKTYQPEDVQLGTQGELILPRGMAEDMRGEQLPLTIGGTTYYPKDIQIGQQGEFIMPRGQVENLLGTQGSLELNGKTYYPEDIQFGPQGELIFKKGALDYLRNSNAKIILNGKKIGIDNLRIGEQGEFILPRGAIEDLVGEQQALVLNGKTYQPEEILFGKQGELVLPRGAVEDLIGEQQAFSLKGKTYQPEDIKLGPQGELVLPRGAIEDIRGTQQTFEFKGNTFNLGYPVLDQNELPLLHTPSSIMFEEAPTLFSIAPQTSVLDPMRINPQGSPAYAKGNLKAPVRGQPDLKAQKPLTDGQIKVAKELKPIMKSVQNVVKEGSDTIEATAQRNKLTVESFKAAVECFARGGV